MLKMENKQSFLYTSDNIVLIFLYSHKKEPPKYLLPSLFQKKKKEKELESV